MQFQNDFAQIPSRILEDASIKNSEQRILSLFELFRFRYNFLNDKTRITNKVIAEKIGLSPDQTLRIIKDMVNHETISQLYSIKFKRQTMNEPLIILVEFKYLLRAITLEADLKENKNYAEKRAVKNIVEKSTFFKSFDAEYLKQCTGAANYGELVKGIMDIESRTNQIENPLSYLISGFKKGKGKYKYSQIIFATVTKKEETEKSKIDDVYIYKLLPDAVQLLKEKKNDKMKFHVFQIEQSNQLYDKAQCIYYATHKGRAMNIQNFLDANEIAYEKCYWKQKHELINKLKISLAS